MHMFELEQQFDELLEVEEYGKAEEMLRQMIEEVPEDERRDAFTAPARIRPDAIEEPEAESLLLDAANALSRRLRNAKYRTRIANGYRGLKIVEIGDSWHQYPIRLDDIIDNVSEEYAVYSLSAAGATLDEMAALSDYREAIRGEDPDIFMISAGGNDVLGEGAFINLIHDYRDGATALDLLDRDRLSRTLSQITATLDEVFRSALAIKPSLRIFTHGYDYVHPREDGKWVGGPLKEKGIPLPVGREIVKIILDRFNGAMEELAGRYPNKAIHVNLLGKADHGPQSWHDEIHPKDAGFGRASDEIIRHIRKVRARSGVGTPPRTRREAMLQNDVSEAYSPLLGDALDRRIRRISRTGRPQENGASALNQFLVGARAKRDALERESEDQYRDKLRHNPAYQAALADINDLLERIDEPESQERIDARREYGLPSQGDFDERVIGDSNLDEFYVLSRGVNVGKAVGKIHIRDQATGRNGSGTGFLVGPQLLMTNNHVLWNRRIAGDSFVAFRYELDRFGIPRTPVFFRLSGDVYFTSNRLDFSLVGVKPMAIDGRTDLGNFGSIPLLPKSGKALKHDYVSIIQHPGGDYKKVALRENKVIGPKEDFLYYVTDTERGSSGSPAFNEIWQVAALHHQAVPDPERPGMYVANRGVRISAICDHVRQAAEAGDPDATEAWRRIQIGLRKGMGDDQPKGREGRRGRSQSGTGAREASQAKSFTPGEAYIAGERDLAEIMGEWTPEQARAVLSDTGYRLILEHETGGPGYYNNVLKQAPTWPGGKSGVTIGVGYDVGYHTLAELRTDWHAHIDETDLSRLEQTVGVRGSAAKALAASLHDIKIPLETAGAVFDARTLPKYVKRTYTNLPRQALDVLHPHCVSALVSLVFNRGASFRKTADRYREMRAILAAMQAMDFARIPDQIRSMKRLWINKGLDGLLRRRDDEAALFERGLAAMAGKEIAFSDTGEAADFTDDEAFAEDLDHEGETIAPPDELFEAAKPHLFLSDARWVSSTRNAPDQWHLPFETADDHFELDASLINAALTSGHYEPHYGSHGKLIISLRGCQIAGGEATAEDSLSITLRATSPDHEHFRCLIGVFDTRSGRISLYPGSTVPRRTGMLGYYDRVNFGANRRLCNMLPTGLYEHCVGTHYSLKNGPVEYVLRLGNGPEPANAGSATVLRSQNDLIYGTADVWDRTTPGDNIHPAFSTASFSSLGCLTVRGSQTHNASYKHSSGEWVAFRKKAGFHGENRGVRYDNLLVTGHECASLAAALASGQSLEDLTCLRHGSSGDAVRRLQGQLGITVDGDFGAGTRKALAILQMQKLGYATGSWSPEMATLLDMTF
jgi:V8-like Glu-specific endopeptidase/GH24 family phage-related lysozyme (muramidase)